MNYIKNKIEKETRGQIRGYERATYEEIAPVAQARKDYEGYSTVLINRVDRNGKYLEVVLQDTDKIQRLANPTKYLVLVDRLGNTQDYYATGKIVRKDLVYGKGEIKTIKDNNVEVI